MRSITMCSGLIAANGLTVKSEEKQGSPQVDDQMPSIQSMMASHSELQKHLSLASWHAASMVGGYARNPDMIKHGQMMLQDQGSAMGRPLIRPPMSTDGPPMSPYAPGSESLCTRIREFMQLSDQEKEALASVCGQVSLGAPASGTVSSIFDHHVASSGGDVNRPADFERTRFYTNQNFRMQIPSKDVAQAKNELKHAEEELEKAKEQEKKAE